MTDKLPPVDSSSQAGTPGETGAGSPPARPRWVKIVLAVAVVLILLVVVLLIVGGNPGGHGPGRHLGDGEPPRETPRSVQARPEGHSGPPPGVEHGPQEP